MSGHEHHHGCGCEHHHHDHECGSECGEHHHHDHECGPECGEHHHHDHECGPECGEHHHHVCGPECGCGHDHHGGEGLNVVANALVFSRQGTVVLGSPQTAEAVLSGLAEKILEIAGLVAVGGAVAGHIKALMTSDAGQAGISITRLASPDLTRLDGWEGDREIDRYALSVAVLSLANTDANVADACAKLYE